MPTATQQFQAKGLREKRGKIKAELEKLGAKITTEQRAMTADEKASFDKLKTDWVAAGEAIKAVETDMQALDALLAADAGDAEPVDDPAADGGTNSAGKGGVNRRQKPKGGDGAAGAQNARDRRLAFSAWARKQHGKPLKPEHVEACKRTGVNPRAKAFEIRIGGAGSALKRAQSLTTTAGGYTVAEGFSGALEQSLVDYSNVRGVCDEFTTDTGADMPYPTEDDTSNTGEQLGEGVEAAAADSTFGSVVFGAFKFSSKGILISSELLNDSEFDLETMLGTQAGIRIGRIQGQRFTTGTGTAQPKGIVACASAGITSGSDTAITGAELTRLAFAVDKAYRNGPKVGYMMHDTVTAYLLTLADGDGRPLLRESWSDGVMKLTLNGFGVHTNQYMQAVTAATGLPVTATKSVLFGDFSKFKVRDVGTVRVRRLDERYAEKDQVGFIAFMRSDSRCVNTAAIKYLLQA